jgi:phosphoribosyl 1,2-cyclic phosphodiesterase
MLRNGRYPLALKQRIIGNDGHLSNDETAELVANHAKDGLKCLFLCHLSEENNSPVLAVETMRRVISEVKGSDAQWSSLPIIALERKVPQVYLLK